jgi:hypothetical protein
MAMILAHSCLTNRTIQLITPLWDVFASGCPIQNYAEDKVRSITTLTSFQQTKEARLQCYALIHLLRLANATDRYGYQSYGCQAYCLSTSCLLTWLSLTNLFHTVDIHPEQGVGVTRRSWYYRLSWYHVVVGSRTNLLCFSTKDSRSM